MIDPTSNHLVGNEVGGYQVPTSPPEAGLEDEHGQEDDVLVNESDPERLPR